MTAGGLKELAVFENLTYLSLGPQQMTLAGLKSLTALKKLDKLNLDQFGMRRNVMDKHFRALREVGLLHVLQQAEGKGGARPRSADEVVALDLSLMGVTDAVFQELAGFKNLAELNVRYTGVTVAGLQRWDGLKNLTALNLGGTAVRDAELKDIARLSKLTRLSLTESKITDRGLKELALHEELDSP